MRILIFLLALISAFFVSLVAAFELDYSDMKQPKDKTEYYMGCLDAGYKVLLRVKADTTPENFVQYCGAHLLKAFAKPTEGQCSADKPILTYTGASVRMTQSTYKEWFWNDGSFGGCTNAPQNNVSLSAGKLPPIINEVCPPDNFPEHLHMVSIENESFCLKEKEPPPPCPEPTGNEIWVGGVSNGKTDVCFDNSNGSQCKIETDDNGSYMLPLKYGSQEPVACKEPEPEPDPEKPDPTPDPEKPDDKDDPTPTPDPETPPEGKDADDADKELPIDALNQVNDNLKVINDNMNQNSETHIERLERMTKETQNSNELLSSVKQNTSSTTLNTGNTVLELGKTNTLLHGIKTKQIEGVKLQGEGVKLLEEIKENTKKDDFTFTAGGRMAGGLDSVFTFEEMAQFDEFIESAEKRRLKLIDDIKKESETLFTIDPNLNSQYEQRLETIKGVEVDLGLSRFSDFFKLIAPAILLAGTLTGLYILLGSNRE